MVLSISLDNSTCSQNTRQLNIPISHTNTMSSSFADSFDQLGGESPAASTQPLHDGYNGFDSFSHFDESDSVTDAAAFNSHQPIPDTVSPPPTIYTYGDDPTEFSPETNGPILQPPTEMQPEEGYALREWRRQNAIRLEEKEKKEKELLSQIIEEAEEYKIEFHKKRQAAVETNKATNREKEKVFLASQEKFHAEADKDYWKSIAEFIPKEVPKIDKKGKKEQEKKPSVVVIQGPKPGKPTDLSRMRQILIKLKHDTPPHLKHSPPPAASASGKDVKDAVVAAPEAAAVEASRQPVAVA